MVRAGGADKNMKKIDFAIFSAMPEELQFFKQRLSTQRSEVVRVNDFNFEVFQYNDKKILFAHTGLGTIFAASIVTLIQNHFSPDCIFLSGTAGAVDPKLTLRDVIIVERAFEAEIQGAFTLLKGTPFETCLTHPLNGRNIPPFYFADEKLLEIARNIDYAGATVHTGTVVTSNTFPAPKELYERIKSENPFTIDMETSAFYQIAWLLKVPALAIRGVSNALDSDGTDDKVHLSDVEGSAEAAAKVLLKILDAFVLQCDDNQRERKETASV